MFTVRGKFYGQEQEVTWQSGSLDDPYVDQEVRNQITLLRQFSEELTTVVAMQEVPLDMTSDLLVFHLLDQLLEDMELVSGSVESLLGAGAEDEEDMELVY